MSTSLPEVELDWISADEEGSMGGTSAGVGDGPDVSELLALLLALRNFPGVRWVQLCGNRLEPGRWPWMVTVETDASANPVANNYAATGYGGTPEGACREALENLRRAQPTAAEIVVTDSGAAET